MAYKAKRSQLYTDTLELTEEDGTVVHTLHVELDPDSMVKKLSEKHVQLIKAAQCIGEADGKTLEEKQAILETSVTAMLEAVFGKNDADVIIRFYNRRYMEICKEIIPFVTGTAIPQVRKIAQENKKQVMQSYNRKQHRLLGRM